MITGLRTSDKQRHLHAHLRVSDLLADSKGPRDNMCRDREMIPTADFYKVWILSLAGMLAFELNYNETLAF